jgi:MSHA biogenesis protein MshQ
VHGDDADSATGTAMIAGSDGSASVRAGRVRLSNVFGSVSPLRMPVEAQYWSGKSWVTNTLDTCTNMTGIFSASPATGWTLTPAALVAGKADLTVANASPGATLITATVPNWLKSKWGGSAAYNVFPSATATIGIFAPEHKKTIHIRELF